MSRVFNWQKYVNMPTRDVSITGPSKIKRMCGTNANCKKACSLTSWLFLKYEMTYDQYRKKSKTKRDALRQEYLDDTQEAKT